jgi:drug/metabolite transporter (DMT)-like permease
MRSDQLDTVQTLVKIIRKLSVFMALAMLALFALAVFLARGQRRETLRTVGFTLIVVGLLLLVVRRLVGNYLIDYLTNSTAVETPSRHAWLIGTDLLAGIAWTGIIYGIVIVLAAVLGGRTRPATWVRAQIGPTLRDRPGFYYLLVALGYGLLLIWGPTPAFRQPLWILIFAALLAVGAEAFRRLTVREMDATAPSPS